MNNVKENPLPSIEISQAKKEDLPTLRTIGLNIPEFAVGTESPSFFSEQALERMSDSNECVVLVAKADQEIAGFILISCLVPARDAYLHTIAVMEKFRKQGIGSQLLEQALQEIRTKHPEINHVFGDVQIENEASLSLLEKHGFQIGRSFRYVDKML